MINELNLEIKVALFILQQIFGTEYVVSGSVSDYINICDMSEYFKPKDLDIVLTSNQLKVLKQYFFIREVEGLYKIDDTLEYFTNIGGCNIDIFIKGGSSEIQTDIYHEGDWKIRRASTKERLKDHHEAIKLNNISNYRKRKHLNRLTFYKIERKAQSSL